MQQAPHITIHYFAFLREQRGLESETIKLTAATARELYQTLARQYGFSLPEANIAVAINDRFAPLDQPLQQGDRVTFIPPVAGG